MSMRRLRSSAAVREKLLRKHSRGVAECAEIDDCTNQKGRQGSEATDYLLMECARQQRTNVTG